MSLATRVIARLDVKPSLGVVKGIRMDGLRKVGDVAELVERYEAQGADEIAWLDVTASLMGRISDHAHVMSAPSWIPLTYGGGIRSFADARRMLRWGAEKFAINTQALATPELITECAKAFGSQAVVVSIEAKRVARDTWRKAWRCFTLGGREPTHREVVSWAREAIERGAGELFVTSVDRDGTHQGYDLELIAALRAALPRTVLTASGGCGSPADAVAALQAGASAIAVGSWLHAGGSIGAIKAAMAGAGHEVRA